MSPLPACLYRDLVHEIISYLNEVDLLTLEEAIDNNKDNNDDSFLNGSSLFLSHHWKQLDDRKDPSIRSQSRCPNRRSSSPRERGLRFARASRLASSLVWYKNANGGACSDDDVPSVRYTTKEEYLEEFEHYIFSETGPVPPTEFFVHISYYTKRSKGNSESNDKTGGGDRLVIVQEGFQPVPSRDKIYLDHEVCFECRVNDMSSTNKKMDVDQLEHLNVVVLQYAKNNRDPMDNINLKVFGCFLSPADVVEWTSQTAIYENIAGNRLLCLHYSEAEAKFDIAYQFFD